MLLCAQRWLTKPSARGTPSSAVLCLTEMHCSFVVSARLEAQAPHACRRRPHSFDSVAFGSGLRTISAWKCTCICSCCNHRYACSRRRRPILCRPRIFHIFLSRFSLLQARSQKENAFLTKYAYRLSWGCEVGSAHHAMSIDAGGELTYGLRTKASEPSSAVNHQPPVAQSHSGCTQQTPTS